MTKADCVIRGGLLVNGQGVTRNDILIGDGIVQQIGQDLQAPDVIDASGKYVLPGIVDAHSHPVFADKIDTFSISAAYGGITTIIPFFGNFSSWGTSGRTSDIIKAHIEELHSTLPDEQMEALAVVTDGDTVVVEFRSSGTAPTGKPYRLDFTEVMELRDGKISMVKVYLDPDEVERAMS